MLPSIRFGLFPIFVSRPSVGSIERSFGVLRSEMDSYCMPIWPLNYSFRRSWDSLEVPGSGLLKAFEEFPSGFLLRVKDVT